MEDKRRFDDACGLAHAMELLGERWAMLVLRELAYGPRRFSDLKADLQGNALEVTYAGTVEDKDSLKGTVDIAGLGNGTFTAKRQP